MKIIESKRSKSKSFDKKKLKTYWKKVYPKDYAEKLVGKSKEELEKIAERMKSVPLKGILKSTKDGFVYLDISNNVIHSMFSLIDEEEIEKPPYFVEENNNVGAHISVMYKDELDDKTEVKEIGEEFNFKLGKFYSVNPEGWDEMERVWFLKAESPELEKLRKKYGLSKLLNGHDFHITVAVKKAE